MRYIYPLDNWLLGPLLTITCLKVLTLPNEMHFSTRQRLCPLVRLVRLDNCFLAPLLSTTCLNVLSLPNEMHFSTRQYCFFHSGQCLWPLVRLDNWLLGPLTYNNVLKVSLMRCIFPLDNACVHSYDSTTDYLGLYLQPISVLPLVSKIFEKSVFYSYFNFCKMIVIKILLSLLKIFNRV